MEKIIFSFNIGKRFTPTIKKCFTNYCIKHDIEITITTKTKWWRFGNTIILDLTCDQEKMDYFEKQLKMALNAGKIV